MAVALSATVDGAAMVVGLENEMCGSGTFAGTKRTSLSPYNEIQIEDGSRALAALA